MSYASAATIAARIRENGNYCIEDRNTADIRLKRTVKRRYASLYYFDVWHAENRLETVVAKAFHPSRMHASAQPRLLRLPDDVSTGMQQYQALTRIEEGFAPLGDERFRTVNVLDHFSDIDTLVMRAFPGTGLDNSLTRLGIARYGKVDRQLKAFENAGALLNIFHQLPDMPDRKTCQNRRRDVQSSVALLASRLREPGTPYRRQIDAAVACVEEIACQQIPSEIPCTILHGDFVLGNVLSLEDGSVATIDTRSPWRAPHVFDVARFLISMKCSGVQSASRSSLIPVSIIARLEDAFLSGYYGSDIPRSLVRAYEILRVLEMWALSVHFRNNSRTWLKRSLKRVRLEWLASFYASQLSNIVREQYE